MARFVRADLAEAKYSGVEPIEALAQSLGIPVSSIVKLNANENQYGVPHVCAAAITGSLTSRTHVYPDPAQAELRAAIADAHSDDCAGIGPEWVVAGAGSDDILDMLIRVSGPAAVVQAPPTFGMYNFLAKINGSIPVVNLARDAAFDLDVDAAVGVLGELESAVVFLPSPNNPTGNLVPLSAVRTLAQSAPHALIVLDEAYTDFAEPGTSALPLVPEYDNLVVCRTFSKWAGLAGTRVGYCVAAPGLVSALLAIKQPYNVNSAAEAGALAALAHKDDIVASSVQALIRERRRVFARLAGFYPAIVPVPSQANFVLAKVTRAAPVSAAELAASLRDRGILIRYFAKQGGDLEAYIRVSAGKPEDTQAFFAGLAAVFGAVPAPTRGLSPATVSTVLFDMDGVLADVSRSYRAAILETAASFGVTLTSADVDAGKAKGNANNDWVLTQRLIAEAMGPDSDGDAPSLDAVTAVFERLYHGDPGSGTDGLYRTESLVVAYDLLWALKDAGLALAVVTGRPRDPDASRFLADFGLASLFDVVVTMDDGPPKPDPAPLRAALTQLGLDHTDVSVTSAALMLGDTVDDMVAATAAGVVPIGVIPPGTADPDALAGTLRDAGAVAVLDPGCHALGQLLLSRV